MCPIKWPQDVSLIYLNIQDAYLVIKLAKNQNNQTVIHFTYYTMGSVEKNTYFRLVSVISDIAWLYVKNQLDSLWNWSISYNIGKTTLPPFEQFGFVYET